MSRKRREVMHSLQVANSNASRNDVIVLQLDDDPTTPEALAAQVKIKLEAIENKFTEGLKDAVTLTAFDELKVTLEDMTKESITLTTQVADLTAKLSNFTAKADPETKHAYEEKGGYGRMAKDIMLTALGRADSTVEKRRMEWETYVKANITLISDGQRTDIGSQGGVLTSSEMATQLMEAAVDNHPILGRVNRINTNAHSYEYKMGKQTNMNAGLNAGVLAAWEHEYSTIAETIAQFEKRKIELFELSALTSASNRMLDESEINLESTLMLFMSMAIQTELEDAVLFGDGVHKPEGMLVSPAKLTVDSASGVGVVSATDIINMDSHSMNGNNVWIYGKQMKPQLANMTLNNNPLYLPVNMGMVSGPTDGQLYGHETINSHYMEAVGTEGDIILLTPEAYLLVIQNDTRFDTSMHLLFDKNAMAFRAVMTVGGHIMNPRTLTETRSDHTFAPVVTLATRTE